MTQRETLSPAERDIRPNSVIVIGGRIAGSIASYILASEGIEVLCLDKENVLEEVRPPCTGCGGLLQPRTVELLSSIGIAIPEEVVRRRLDGFVVHLPRGSTLLVPTPGLLAVYRGFGPLEGTGNRQGFDSYLLHRAIEKGAKFSVANVEQVTLREHEKVQVETQEGQTYLADFVVGAFGHSSLSQRIQVPEGYGLDSPKVQTSSVHEFRFDEEFCKRTYDNNVHVVIIPKTLAPHINIRFAAFIPKDKETVSMVLLGRYDVSAKDVSAFLSSPFITDLLPQEVREKKSWEKLVSHGGSALCMCTRNQITNNPPSRFSVPIEGGILLAGDAGPTRIWKDGIGSAIETAIEAAKSIASGTPEAFTEFTKVAYPPDDARSAKAILELDEWFIGNPTRERWLATINRRRVPILSRSLKIHLRHVLTADIPYSAILPKAITYAIKRAFHESEAWEEMLF